MAWWNCNYNGLEPETANLIDKVDYTKSETGKIQHYKCGCEKSFIDPPPAGFWFHICCWHEGFDEGVCVVKGQEI